MLRRTEEIYTSIEEVFLEGLLNLLEIPYTKADNNKGIKHIDITYECDEAQFKVIYTAMRYHYNKNFN